VIRRILRRAALYGRHLGLSTGFFERLVDPVVASLGDVFPELRRQEATIRRVIRSEEESFGRTLERGLKRFDDAAASGKLPSQTVFELYDTYGFPLDLTQVIAAERGIAVDVGGFEALMEEQRERGRAAQKKEVIVAATEGSASTAHAPTAFTGYLLDRERGTHATLQDVVNTDHGVFLVFDKTPFYAEMGGQLGDTGHALVGGSPFSIIDTVKDKSGRHLHKVSPGTAVPEAGAHAELSVDQSRRRAIQRNHTATHLLHWALRKILGTHVRQAGSLNAPDRLRFDFSHFEAVTHAQIREIEELVNQRVLDNASVMAYEVDFDKKPEGTLAFFGEKYGKVVRVVDIGGYSRELCAGTHVATTGEIGLIKVVHESAIAAGTRRIEAVAGEGAYRHALHAFDTVDFVAQRLGAAREDLQARVESLLVEKSEAEKKLRSFEQKASANLAGDLASKAAVEGSLRFVSAVVAAETPDALRALGSQVLGQIGEGVVRLGAAFGDKAAVVAFSSPGAIKAGYAAGRIVNLMSAELGGKGGGKPDFAMGGGREVAKLQQILASPLPRP
jgi:alanyl-tRNA synthetase